jgi:adenylate kinase
MKDGKLVPDHLLFKVLTAELEANKGRTILLDGYPRNVNQAKTLANLGGESQVRACVHLDVGQVELVARLSGRRVCGACGASYHVEYAPPGDGDKCTKCGGGVVQRPDDAADKVAVRLDVYQRETMPVLDFYMGAGIYKRVDGARETNIVFGDLKKVIEGLAKA